jgi:hypothetical protein
VCAFVEPGTEWTGCEVLMANPCLHSRVLASGCWLEQRLPCSDFLLAAVSDCVVCSCVPVAAPEGLDRLWLQEGVRELWRKVKKRQRKNEGRGEAEVR